MAGDAWNVTLNIIASAITGSVVWLTGRFVTRHRLRRKKVFFGLDNDTDCLLAVPRHASSNRENSVHRTDVATLLELSAIIQSCGARPEVSFHDQTYQGLGGKTEFCVGGPEANQRTAAYLRSALPGIHVHRYEAGRADSMAITVAGEAYPPELGKVEYAVLAKITRDAQVRPAFVISGQTSAANRAAGRYLAFHYRELIRTHGRGRFCILLRVLEPQAYGPTVVELVRDATSEAFDESMAMLDDPQV
jgi:hypothetical protein